MQNSSNVKVGDILVFKFIDTISCFEIIKPVPNGRSQNFHGICVRGAHNQRPEHGMFWNIRPEEDCYIGLITFPISKLERIIYGINDEI